MGAIYDVQLQINRMKDQLNKDQQKLNEHHSRLAFLRDVARERLGESP